MARILDSVPIKVRGVLFYIKDEEKPGVLVEYEADVIPGVQTPKVVDVRLQAFNGHPSVASVEFGLSESDFWYIQWRAKQDALSRIPLFSQAMPSVNCEAREACEGDRATAFIVKASIHPEDCKEMFPICENCVPILVRQIRGEGGGYKIFRPGEKRVESFGENSLFR